MVDSSYLIALYDTAEPRHQQAYAFATHSKERMLVPNVVLTEVGFLLRRNLGYINSMRFLGFFDRHDVQLVALVEEDLPLVREIAITYADSRLDIVDCCIMAIALRLNITRIATFDRRDFSMFRPRQGKYLRLLP